MNAYLAHLATLHAYWINLDASTDRARHWTVTCAPLFAGATRVAGVDASRVTDAQLQRFVEAWRVSAAREAPRYAGRFNTYMLTKCVPRPVFKRRARRAEIAIATAHHDALLLGLEDGHARFVVAEDDAVPRRSIWTENLPVPPANHDVAVHGGGLQLAAVRTDDAHFDSGAPHLWRPVTSPFNTLGATLYEVTRRGAEAIIRAVREHPMAFDQSWAFALIEVPSVVLRPNAFAQVGASVRNGVVRTPSLERPLAPTHSPSRIDA